MTSILLLPLDERPVNTRYPQMLGAVGGADVLLPPVEVRGRHRTPANLENIAQWLRAALPDADAVAASAEFLLYGNLIGSRISCDSAAHVVPRLAPLEEAARQGKPVYAFSLITRVSNADDCVEEPLYWADYGTRFHQYSALLHRRERDALDCAGAANLARLQSEIPAELTSDWLQRRLRNHTVSLALLDMVARGDITFLLITSDDTSAWGLPSREKAWLEEWIRLLGDAVEGRTLMHPGADEVGSALIARILCRQREYTPRIYPLYAIPGGEEIIAPYEDRAVRLTVEGQIRACGGVPAASEEEADIILGVLTPSLKRTEFRAEFAEEERAGRTPFYEDHFARLGEWQRRGKPVALADVAYPNGSDPLAIEMLLSPDCPLNVAELAAYGAWNTAGNTLGVVIAQAVCAQFIDGDPARLAAQQRFLAHRFLEDYGYQAVVRREARTHLTEHWGSRDPESVEQVADACAAIETGLSRILLILQGRGIGADLRIRPGSVALPWNRTSEVDFDLT